MWINTPNENSEVQKTQSEIPKMPNDHPEKQGIFSGISDALRNLSKFLGFSEQNENGDKKANKFQTFLASIIGIFNGIDIKKGATVEKSSDISKIREAFRPIIDLNETGIVFQAGDFIIFNENTGTVDFYPADKTQKSGHSTEMSGTVVVAPRKIPAKTSEQIETEYELKKNNQTVVPKESNETKTTTLASQLWRWLSNNGPARTGNNSCGKAVHALLDKFGIKNVGQQPRHGNKWHNFLENDSRFKKIEINDLSEIPSGAIMTYSGKWHINGKPNGSIMNQKFWHVEIKWSNKLFYSFNGANNPGGSAREPQLHNNFTKWKEATGFTGAFVPIIKTHEENKYIKKAS